GVRFLVHENTKILFRFYYSLSMLHSIIFGCLYLSELFRLRYECFLIDFRYILLTRCIGIASIVSSHHIILVMSFERLFSSIFPAYFERNSSKLLAVSLGFTAVRNVHRLNFELDLCSTIISSSYTMLTLSDSWRLFREIKIPIPNELLPQNVEVFVDFCSVLTISYFFSFLIACFDLYLNFLRKPAVSTTLAVTYQIAENRKVILILLPIELMETMLNLFTTVAQVLYGKPNSDRSPHLPRDDHAHRAFSTYSLILHQ
ncbi:hypothetical protein PMAYCL1PPCAC_20763, partial [Pristionchus mayeri]